jgi:hypothetical protein
MITYTIEQERQNNELWSIPANCVGIDRILLLDKRKELLYSAAIALFNQIWNCKFEIINSTYHSFKFKKIESLFIRNFTYNLFELIDNQLYYFDTEYERKVFLRKYKLKQLENIN